MPEYPNAHPGAPLTLWLRRNPAWEAGCYTTTFPEASDAVEYIRKDVCDAMLTEASRRPDARALAEAVERRGPDEIGRLMMDEGLSFIDAVTRLAKTRKIIPP